MIEYMSKNNIEYNTAINFYYNHSFKDDVTNLIFHQLKSLKNICFLWLLWNEFITDVINLIKIKVKYNKLFVLSVMKLAPVTNLFSTKVNYNIVKLFSFILHQI